MTKALRFLAALLVAFPVFAQAQRTYSQPELDQMLAPIALYPDALLAQVLMAATYPHEVAAAARWSRANPSLQGDDAVRAVAYEDWDPSVKSLIAFPQILARMDEHPDWTRGLGEAFLAQEPHVMDTVQQLRRRARAAGQLTADQRLSVIEQSNSIIIQSTNPQIVYVPYYDPRLVYGPWWWPGYQPVYWAPWPRQYGIRVSLGFFFGDFDWHHRHVRVVHPTVYYYRSPFAVNRTVAVTPHRWQHEPLRREAFAARRAAQSAQQIQVQPQIQRQEHRVEPQQQRQQSRAQVNALPSVQVQPAIQTPALVQVRPRADRRDDRREERQRSDFERRETRQAQPQARPQPHVRAQAQPEIRPQPQVRAQPEIRPQPQVRAQPEARPQPQVRQEQRARMPEAVAPQQLRVERQERRELRQERRNERGNKGSERS